MSPNFDDRNDLFATTMVLDDNHHKTQPRRQRRYLQYERHGGKEDVFDTLSSSSPPQKVGAPVSGDGDGRQAGGGSPIVGNQPLPTEPQCFVALVIADGNDNDALEMKEYVQLVNHLTNHEWSTASSLPVESNNNEIVLQSLPTQFQNIFFTYMSQSGSRLIPIYGARPSTTNSATRKQREALLGMCNAIVRTSNQELLGRNNGGGQGDGSLATSKQTGTTATTTLTSTPQEQSCLDAMILSDEDRNRFLDKKEFVIFSNILSNGVYGQNSASSATVSSAVLFGNLPSRLQSDYRQFQSSVDGLSVSGARSSASATQRQEAIQLCNQIRATIDQLLNPPPPTPLPTPALPIPTPFPRTPSPTTAMPTRAPTRRPTPTPSRAPSSAPSPFPSNGPLPFSVGTPLPTATTSTLAAEGGTTPSPVVAAARSSATVNPAILGGSIAGAVVLLAILLCLLVLFFRRNDETRQREQQEKISPQQEELPLGYSYDTEHDISYFPNEDPMEQSQSHYAAGASTANRSKQSSRAGNSRRSSRRSSSSTSSSPSSSSSSSSSSSPSSSSSGRGSRQRSHEQQQQRRNHQHHRGQPTNVSYISSSASSSIMSGTQQSF